MIALPRVKPDVLRYLESHIDFWRVREKDQDMRKTYTEVFDTRTLMALYKLFTRGVIDRLEFPISTGKESNVYRAYSRERGLVAVKIYRISTLRYRTIEEYVQGDPRFEQLMGRVRHLVYLWTRKEFRNLSEFRAAGVPVPEPITFWRNVLVMGYLGTEERPAPLLLEVTEADWDSLFLDIANSMRRAYLHARLVHSDLSEYNVMLHRGRCYFIDVAQAVSVEHPRASEFLARDVRNVVKFFSKKGLRVKARNLYRYVRGEVGEDALREGS